MKILICNERFLFRFGLDRVLILLAQGLFERGHEVYLMGCRCDEAIVRPFTQKLIQVPPAPDDYANSDEFTAEWLEAHWSSLFSPTDQPDVVITGGWPFFQSLEFFSRVCQTVLFVDAGAVPLDGFSGHGRSIQEKLRKLRRTYLSKATGILPISEFIAKTQSIPDRGSDTGVQSILLGADHLEMPLWKQPLLQQKKSSGSSLEIVERLQSTGRVCILNLGRWEAGCYKNSEACFDLVRRLMPQHPQIVLLVLAEPSDLQIPRDLRGHLRAIGFPDDAELQTVMQQVKLGVSVSLWEGFNLPLAEMQWLQKPALAFDLAAHPEVVVHPWFLCADAADMAEKVSFILSDRIPDSAQSAEHYDRFRSQFRWQAVVDRYCQTLSTAVQTNHRLSSSTNDVRLLLIDVTNSCRDAANSGVIRVTRQLCRALQTRFDPVFVVWDFATERYVLPSEAGYQQLGQFNGPHLPSYALTILERYGQISLDEFLTLKSDYDPRQTRFLLAETVIDPRVEKAFAYGKQQGWKTSAIFYDLIPVLHPELCSNSVSSLFVNYLQMLSGVDQSIAISEYSATCLLNYWAQNKVNHGNVVSVLLPGEFSQNSRTVETPDRRSNLIKILCVSTLEPRKNHITLLKSFELLAQRYPHLDWRLTLVGNRYEGAPEIYEAVKTASAKDSRIEWLGVVDDAKLHQLYEQSTFTIYSSLIEGFGMPILESVWHGRVCLCHREGVMAELAAEGGCWVVDMTDAAAIADAINTLSADPSLLTQLSEAASNRQLKNWDDYAQEVSAILGLDIDSGRSNMVSSLQLDSSRWEDLLYPNCLLERWQMHDSERIALTGLLARHQPKCCIEIGTYYGGSLSLLDQYSEMVFSIDIDPEVPSRLPGMKNVSYLTGQSSILLPLLFTALEEEHIPIDFVLIDGDHSAEGVRRDIEIILTYRPKKPMLVVMHDSFNPGCRQGIMTANWRSSPYVTWLDVDFVPGRIVESDNPFGGEMWGGLALALLSPTPRQGDLIISASATSLYELALHSRQ